MKDKIEDIKESFYKKDNIYRTKVFEVIDENEEHYMDLAVNDMLMDGEVLFAYEDAAKDNNFGFIFYKSKSKILWEYIYASDEGIEFDLSLSCWNHPKTDNLSSLELREFAIKLREYINYNELPITILPESIYDDIEKSKYYPNLSEKCEKKVIALAKFWRWGYFIILMPILLIANYLLAKETLLLILSIYFLVYGGYFIIGNTKRFRHIYCAYQDWDGKEMSPSIINWESVGSIKFVIPGFFIFIGLACLIGFLITI